MNSKNIQKKQRATRTRGKVRGTSERPRLSVFRSNATIYAQIIDDSKHVTLLGLSEKDMAAKEKQTNVEKAKELGVSLAQKAKEKKIKTVVFDKGSYAYHGRVKALAEGAREGGLIF